MELQVGLWQQQTLKLAMTQELKQAIELLQYSSQELTSFLESKALENPLIQLKNANIKLVDFRNERSNKYRMKNDSRDQKNLIEQTMQPSTTLQDYLFMQLSMKALSNIQKNIFKNLIYNLDTNGYLTIKLEEMADYTGNPVAAEECLQMLQSLEPAGVGARNLQECLLLQVRRKQDCPALVKKILENSFLPFAERKWKQLSKQLNVEIQDIQLAADFIQTLNPRPGSPFNLEKPQYVVPDLVVTIQNQEIRLDLFEKHLPSVHYEKDYYKMMSGYRDQQVKQFLKEKTQDFHWITRSLEQRKETLLKVGTAITLKQREFFLNGPTHLKPLTMKDIADVIEVHESTVSRAVREKYIQTPYGTYEMKYFFSTGLARTNEMVEEQASSTQVKNFILERIKEEDKSKPLSDQLIADQLKGEGIIVSRRTVAKYRDQLNIAPSSKRKRY